MKKTAVFCIITSNYIADARVLMNSLKETNPQWERVCIIADDIKSEILDEDLNNFTILQIPEELIASCSDRRFWYTPLQYTMSLCAVAVLYLFEYCNYDRAVFFDTDILAFDEMTEIDKIFDNGYSAIFTPHFTRISNNSISCSQSQWDYALTGLFNTGFFAFQRDDEIITFLKWWDKHLEKECIQNSSRHTFLEQGLADMVINVVSRLFIQRNVGYNVAHWNLDYLNITEKDGKYFVNGEPLKFFHFSSWNWKDTNRMVTYDDSYTPDTLGKAYDLYMIYRELLIGANKDYYKDLKYSFACFSDDKPIKPIYRNLYRNNETVKNACANNPFSCSELFESFDYSFTETDVGHEYLVLADKWMEKIDCGIRIADLLLEHGISEVAIYGYGILGKRLYKELKRDKFNVSYIIDRNDSLEIDEVDVCSLDNILPDTQMVIVTVMHDYIKIGLELRGRGLRHITNLREILEW